MAHSALRHGRFGINVRRGARSGRTTARFDGRGRLPADNVHLQDPALQRPSASAPNAPAPPRGRNHHGQSHKAPRRRHRFRFRRAQRRQSAQAGRRRHHPGGQDHQPPIPAAAVPVGHRDPLGRRHRAHHAADPEAEQELQSAARRGRGHRPAGTDGHLPADGDADRTEVRQPGRGRRRAAELLRQRPVRHVRSRDEDHR